MMFPFSLPKPTHLTYGFNFAIKNNGLLSSRRTCSAVLGTDSNRTRTGLRNVLTYQFLFLCKRLPIRHQHVFSCFTSEVLNMQQRQSDGATIKHSRQWQERDLNSLCGVFVSTTAYTIRVHYRSVTCQMILTRREVRIILKEKTSCQFDVKGSLGS